MSSLSLTWVKSQLSLHPLLRTSAFSQAAVAAMLEATDSLVNNVSDVQEQLMPLKPSIDVPNVISTFAPFAILTSHREIKGEYQL